MQNQFLPDVTALLAAMRYGCIPITFLNNIINEIKSKFSDGVETEFIIDNNSSTTKITETLYIAIQHYKNKEKWAKLIKDTMNISNPLKSKTYLDCYNRLLNNEILIAK